MRCRKEARSAHDFEKRKETVRIERRFGDKDCQEKVVAGMILMRGNVRRLDLRDAAD